jgi:hypothetical protein
VLPSNPSIANRQKMKRPRPPQVYLDSRKVGWLENV